METKHCVRCNQDHPLTEFLVPGKRHGRLCRLCLAKDDCSTESKQCSRCQQEQPLGEFSVKTSGKRTSWCRTCNAAYQKAYRPAQVQVPAVKQCRTCHQTKEIQEFHRRTSSTDGHHSLCKDCHTASVRKAKARTLICASWGNISVRTACRWMAQHHLTYQELEHLLAQENCAICKTPFQANLIGQIDHDHATGVVRGLLCLHCNLILGHARDQPDILRAALIYLETESKLDLTLKAK